MPAAHRNGDSRYCGAATIVSGQSTVYVNGKLWAVVGDIDSHSGGALIAAYGSLDVYAEGILVIVAPGDHAGSEPIPPWHPSPATWPNTGSPDTYAY